MARHVLRRLLLSGLLIWVVSMALFAVLRVLPGDPTLTLAGTSTSNLDPGALRAVRHELGLDRSLPAQYWSWVSGVPSGDLGSSYFSQFPVNRMVAERVMPTVYLAICSLVVALLWAIPLGVARVLWPSGWFSKLIDLSTAALLAVPVYAFGVILVLVLAVKNQFLPARGYVSPADDWVGFAAHLVLPSLTLGLVVGAPILLVFISSLRESLAAPYARTARGKGLSYHSTVVRHAFPNALLPALTLTATSVGFLLGGVVVVEFVFGWPGLGSLIVDAVAKRDYAVLQSAVLLIAAIFIAVNTVTDIAYGFLDPRVRRDGS